MNYLTQPFGFKLKKVIRYVIIFGPIKTFIKIKSQWHMRKKDGFAGDIWVNPKAKKRGDIAIVGCGNFSFSVIAYYLKKSALGNVKYTLDIDESKAKSLAKEYGVYMATTNYATILNDDEIKIIYIASNHASHAEYAIEAIKAGKSVHIEKPHVVREEQLTRLLLAMKDNPKPRVFLGFNRPKSSLFKKLIEKIDNESGSLMMNWFIAGHEIEDGHWYFSEAEGGRILGNLCHWSDLCIHMVGMKHAFPCTIHAGYIEHQKSNFAITITFHDGSQAGITFSAKGHTFEGVREYLNVHKGNLLASLRDFQTLSTDVIDKKNKHALLFRDHGHQANILNSYLKATSSDAEGESMDYIKGTGLLALRIKEAVETGKPVICSL